MQAGPGCMPYDMIQDYYPDFTNQYDPSTHPEEYDSFYLAGGQTNYHSNFNQNFPQGDSFPLHPNKGRGNSFPCTLGGPTGHRPGKIFQKSQYANYGTSRGKGNSRGGFQGNNIICHFCKQPGHRWSRCYHLGKHVAAGKEISGNTNPHFSQSQDNLQPPTPLFQIWA